ncbi:hypothetical protein MMC14_002793 [Varicellaria rhodocarpa]|nr:hypothetical protein [Varicellaria rhodocarpa]
MSKVVSHPKITPRRSSDRGHADHGWLNSYHTFSFASYYAPQFESFGSLRVLNEDRVAAHTGFPTHSHRDAEIFSYILSGELTHRDSMVKKNQKNAGADDFFQMKRGDVQFTTGGKGIAHSEQNESSEQVHFLQIWALPWSRSLTPRYHTATFPSSSKCAGFIPIISPLAAGPHATAAQEVEAVPAIPGTIPIHADLVMGAGIVGVGAKFGWGVGGEGENDGVTDSVNSAVRKTSDRRVYVHLPMTKGGRARVELGVGDAESVVLEEGDGAFVEGVGVGDVISVESVGTEEAEVVILDSD